MVEHAYGQLNGRWQCLLKRLDVNISHVPELVEVTGDSFNDDRLEGVALNSSNAANTHKINRIKHFERINDSFSNLNSNYYQ